MLQGVLRAGPALLSFVTALIAVSVVVVATAAKSDTYPSRPVTIIVPFPPSGSSDIVMRLVAQRVSENTGNTL